MYDNRYSAAFFDGQSAAKQDVVIDIDRIRQVVVISVPDGPALGTWPLVSLRRVRDVADGFLHLHQTGDDTVARLIVSHNEAQAVITALATDLDSRDMSWGIWRKIALWSGGAVAALALMIFVIVPALAGSLAPLIPAEREQAIGRSALGQIEWVFSGRESSGGEWFCNSSDGDVALAKMLETVQGNFEIPYDLQVRVVNHDMVNAFALPGGQIILMQGLLDAASNAEQVASVLAHELGHVFHRDPIEQALRAGGSAGLLSLMIGDVTGGLAIGLIGDQLINSSYSRQAESRADVFALDRMQNANMNPEAFAGFFDILLNEMGDASEMEEALAWISTHPMSTARANAARGAVVIGQNYDPVLTKTEWTALKNICD
ncbi:MAG: M48 family metallopeptidase [Planktomarina sp.]